MVKGKINLKNQNFLYLILLLFVGAGNTKKSGGVEVAGNGIRFIDWPYDVTANLGASVAFQCRVETKGGNESPTVRWLHNGTFEGKEVSKSLILSNLRWSDQGSYQCAVSWSGGTVLSSPGTLRISRAPSFAIDPQATSAPVGGSVRFQCSARAVPPALVTWLHNSLPLTDIRHSRFRILDSGILQISDVRTSDEGSYLCFASNSAGNATSRPAALTTTSVDVPPNSAKGSFIAAPRNQTVFEGRNAVFECFFASSTTPEVTWKRMSGGNIDGDRMEVIASNLKIRQADKGDEGFYACTVKQETAEPITSKAYLSVFYAPVIKEQPELLNKRRGETARFRCFSEGNPPPTIVWYKNGERVHPHGRHKLFPAEDEPVSRIRTPQGQYQFRRDLVISSVQPDDVGVYQCLVSNEVGTVSAAAELGFVSERLNISDEAPRNLVATVDRINNRILLDWDAPPGIPTDKVAIYIVHFYETNGKSSSENTHPASKEDCDAAGHCQSFCCTTVELEPYKNYTFLVSVLMHGGIFSPQSNAIIVQTWDGTAREAAPLTVTGLSGGVKLDWEIPDVPGQLKEFRIEYRREDEPRIRTHIVPYLIQEHTLNGLIPGSTYYFRVIPKTRGGYPTNLPETKFPWTTQDIHGNEEIVVIEAPLMNVKSLNSTSVLLSWEQEGDASVAKFRITHQLQTGPDGPTRELDVSGSARELVITGLAPSSLYEVSVRGVSESGRPGLESSQMVRTLREFKLWCEAVGPGKVLVRWSPSLTDRDISRYRLRYSPVSENPADPLNASTVEYLEATEREVEVKFLIPNKEYIFAVKSFDRFNYTGPYSQEFACLSPALPGPPRKVEIETINSSSIGIFWERPNLRNGTKVLAYTVELRSRKGEKWKETTVDVSGSQRKVVLTGLSPSDLYLVRVSAVTVLGRGESSEVEVGPPIGRPPTTPAVIVKVSYKEGLIVGGVVAAVCLIFCALVLYCRIKQDRRNHGVWFLCPGGRSSPRKLNGHLPNAPSQSAVLPETQELQTLLPAYESNPDCDSKGGVNGAQPRCSRLLRGHPHAANRTHGGAEDHLTEDLVVAVISNGDACRDGGVEVGSDLSHSPAATASSLHSWNQEDRIPHHTSAISMPNLADSGIGFDEHTARLYKGQCGLCGGKNGLVHKPGMVSQFRRGTATT